MEKYMKTLGLKYYRKKRKIVKVANSGPSLERVPRVPRNLLRFVKGFQEPVLRYTPLPTEAIFPRVSTRNLPILFFPFKSDFQYEVHIVKT